MRAQSQTALSLPSGGAPCARPAAAAGRRRGFTFLEVMVVIVLLGVLMAVTLPNMRGTGQVAALRGAARELAAGLRIARQRAISTHREVFVLFDLEGDRWRINLNIDPEEEPDSHRYSRDSLYELEMPVTLPPKVFFDSVASDEPPPADQRDSLAMVVFYPDGRASAAQITLRNERGRALTVELAASTGRVLVYEGAARSLEERIAALGAKPQDFGFGQPASVVDSGAANPNDPNAERLAREREQRERYYQDVVSRIVGQRQGALDRSPRR